MLSQNAAKPIGHVRFHRPYFHCTDGVDGYMGKWEWLKIVLLLVCL